AAVSAAVPRADTASVSPGCCVTLVVYGSTKFPVIPRRRPAPATSPAVMRRAQGACCCYQMENEGCGAALETAGRTAALTGAAADCKSAQRPSAVPGSPV